MEIKDGIILDARGSGGTVRLAIKSREKKHVIRDTFSNYLYLLPEERVSLSQIRRLQGVESAEEVEMRDGHSMARAYKVHVGDQQDLAEVKHRLRDYGETREGSFPMHYRYLIDRDLYCSTPYNVSKGKALSFEKTGTELVPLKVCAYDIETYNKGGMPDPEKDPIVSIAYCDENGSMPFTWKNSPYKDEKGMIKAFLDKLKIEDPDVIIGYNSDLFDFPYLKKRCNKLRIKMDLGVDGSDGKYKKTGLSGKVGIFGRVHFDALKAVSFLVATSGLRLSRKKLEVVYKEMLGKDKLDIDSRLMHEYWDSGKVREITDYNESDALATYEIGMYALPLYVELSKIAGLPMQDVVNMSSTQIIEWILIRDAHKNNALAPKRPNEDEVKRRSMEGMIKGAFVKLPKQGLHENIVVCDFRSLYPSIIISHNIGPDTLHTARCREYSESPQGHRFCKDYPSLVAEMLKRLIGARAEIKKKMKELPEGQERKTLYWKQQGLKLIANATYGYINFERARWYTREGAESTTAWGRHYIQDTIEKAEKDGFDVLYADTDSTFLKLGAKKTDDAKAFVRKINKDLPGFMELEYEGFYPRGLFVTKKEGTAAKKRYAILREDGVVQITGLEFVRRDWAPIARKAQEEVVKAVLQDGKPEKAKKIAKDIIKRLRDGKAGMDDLIVYTPLSRSLASYDATGPHIKAAERLQAAGYKVKAGTVVGYVITKGSGKMISDRAYPIELINKREYDPEYYIKHQVLPAVMKILAEFGVNEDELCLDHRQSGLGAWT